MSSLAREVAGNIWAEPFEVYLPYGGPATLADVIKEIIDNRRPGTKLRFSKPRIDPRDCWGDESFVFGLQVDNNPWEDAESLAQDVGMRLYFDDEVCVLDYDDDEIDRLARIDVLNKLLAKSFRTGADPNLRYVRVADIEKMLAELEGRA